jgi:hypothetical protein
MTVTSITPNYGSPAGGTVVVIVGTGFVAGATVVIGGVAATSVVVDDGTSITCVTGAHAAGVVSAVVTNPDTTTANTPFSYLTSQWRLHRFDLKSREEHFA